MHRLLSLLTALLEWLNERDGPVDIIETMNPHERADLPVYHPLSEPRRAC
ncbi:hypothetical protein [Devosia geojensis]|nr:hypothetical protein [Devosia geojensis]